MLYTRYELFPDGIVRNWPTSYRKNSIDFWIYYSCFLFFLFLFFVTPEGFTTVVANEGLEKARAYLNQVRRDRRLFIPSEGCGVNFRCKHLQTTPTHFFGQS